jgi:hypothetical protein
MALSTGIPAVFALAKEFHKTPAEINNVSFNWSVFLAGVLDHINQMGVPWSDHFVSYTGWGGLIFVPFTRKYGRLSTLFWTQVRVQNYAMSSLGWLMRADLQVLALGLLVGVTFAPNLKIYTGHCSSRVRCSRKSVSSFMLLVMRVLTSFFGYVKP